MSRDRHPRCGMILLLVLSMLTLFLVTGTTLIVMATRTRAAARGFMKAAGQVDASPTIPRGMLNEALLLVLRGPKIDARVAVGKPFIRDFLTESLLQDMYVADLSRVPFRIPPNPLGLQYDAFDFADDVGVNKYLAKLNDDGTGTVSTASFRRPASGPMLPIEVDNDGDGKNDGVWLADILPTVVGPNGGELTFRVSYLVLDLDGRINVNAHGGGGSPVGPASIDGSSLTAFAGNRWTVMQNGGTPAASTMTMNLRQPPVLGQAILGRGSSAYALRLDREAPRPAALTGTVAQNPFTLGELERVLRPFDRDWSALPPRLAAILDDLDNSARQTVTTDSWDVTSRIGGTEPPAVASPTPQFDLTSFAGDKAGFAQALYTALTTVGDPAKMPPANGVTAQWCANVAEFRDPASGATAIIEIPAGTSYTGAKPSDLSGAGGAWSGGFESNGDLVGVPVGTAIEITNILGGVGILKSLVADYGAILDAVSVPSRFAATIAQSAAREPGRVNVNTCSPTVWNALTGSGGPTPTKPAGPITSEWGLIRDTAFAQPPTEADIRLLRNNDRATANRMASAATVRSNVFAIWITLEVKDGAITSNSTTYHRLFAIVDRSIPVIFVAGENRDVTKTIRLKRFLN